MPPSYETGSQSAAVKPSSHPIQRAATYDPTAYKSRNVIERMFCRLKDFRRVATRYDKRADTFLSTVLIAATILGWLN